LTEELSVRPIGLASVALTPTTVVGGNPVTGTATLECAAGPGPVTVDLSTTDAAVAAPIAATVVVPQGVKSETFNVATNPVLSKSSAMITGEASATTKSRRLNVVPAAAVSPNRLQFGSQAVGTTSAPLSATLRNDGVVPFVVNSIGLTGAYASWFAQTNNCPASLPAGASCTIAVTFTPAAVLSPGDAIPLELLWQAAPDFAAEPPLVVVVQLLDQDGQVVASLEQEPLGGRYPTSQWQPGELVRDRHGLAVPDSVAPGDYKLIVGLYRAADGQRLTTSSGPLSLRSTDTFVVSDIIVQ